MKKFLCICLLFQSIQGSSQSNTGNVAVTNAQTFGYVDGIRMDSLNAEYALFDWGSRRSFFDYGQSVTKKMARVTDKKGERLMFAGQSVPFMLNFLYFNGWQLIQDDFRNYQFIIKKRHDQ